MSYSSRLLFDVVSLFIKTSLGGCGSGTGGLNCSFRPKPVTLYSDEDRSPDTYGF